MPRYVIECFFDRISEAEIQETVVRTKYMAIEQFPEIQWEHSHVCVDGGSGAIRSFCVYRAPNEDQLRQHAKAVGGHQVDNLYEIVDDITPDDVIIS